MNREVEIVITSNALYDVEGMERHELVEERFMVVVAKKAVPPQATLREIAGRLPMLRYSRYTESGPMIDRHLRRHRLNISSSITFDAPEDLLRAAAAGYGWAIAAPTQVLHVFEEARGVEFRPLPPPGLSHSITLVSRTGELGELPAQTAALCREVLAKNQYSRMQQLMPELAGHFSVVSEAGVAVPPA